MIFRQTFGKLTMQHAVTVMPRGRCSPDAPDVDAHLQERGAAPDRHHGPGVEEITAAEAPPIPYYDGS